VEVIGYLSVLFKRTISHFEAYYSEVTYKKLMWTIRIELLKQIIQLSEIAIEIEKYKKNQNRKKGK